MNSTPLLPRQKTPDLKVQTLDHGSFDLSEEQSARGTLVVFYRGLHCPICATYLKELAEARAGFVARDVDVIAISSDTPDRARLMQQKVEADDLRFGYGLDLQVARDWGLFISRSIGKTSLGLEEPMLFAEPGLFLVSPDQQLYYSAVQSMPFGRPKFQEFLGALDFVIAKKYPARGEYAGEV